MKVRGSMLMGAPRERVWEALTDVDLVRRALPGCERLEAGDGHAYRLAGQLAVAAVRGAYAGEARLTERRPPEAMVVHVTGCGTPGTVTASARITLLSRDDGTRVGYDVDLDAAGPIAGVGGRLLGAAADRAAAQFLRNLHAALADAARQGDPIPVQPPQGAPAAVPVPQHPPAAGSRRLAAFGLGVLVGIALGRLGRPR